MTTATETSDRSRPAPGPSTTPTRAPASRSSTAGSRSSAAASSRSTRRSSPTTTDSCSRARVAVDEHQRRRREHPAAPARRRTSSTPSAIPRSASARPRSAARPTTSTVAGELSMAGLSLPVEATGRLRGPVDVRRGAREARALARDDDRPHRVRHGLADGAAGRRAGARQRRPALVELELNQELIAMRILAIAGSVRRDSHNARLLRHVGGAGAGRGRGRDLGRPQVDPALRRGRRRRAAAARRSPSCARRSPTPTALLFATPEYNSSIPGVLKNAIDWASRPRATTPLQSKPAAVIGASTGSFGAVWAQAELRKVLASTGARVDRPRAAARAGARGVRRSRGAALRRARRPRCVEMLEALATEIAADRELALAA